MAFEKPDIVEHSAVLKRSGICMSRWRAFDEKEMEQVSLLDMSKTIDDTYAAEMLGSGKPKEAPEVVNYCVELEEVVEKLDVRLYTAEYETLEEF